MAKEKGIAANGIVEEILGNDLFRVKLENGHVVIAHLSGKLRKNHIRVILFDKVICEMSPYDLNRGRITYRGK